jgi:hypothetical protein
LQIANKGFLAVIKDLPSDSTEENWSRLDVIGVSGQENPFMLRFSIYSHPVRHGGSAISRN